MLHRAGKAQVALGWYGDIQVVQPFWPLPRLCGPIRRCSFVNVVQSSLQSSGVQTNIPDRD